MHLTAFATTSLSTNQQINKSLILIPMIYHTGCKIAYTFFIEVDKLAFRQMKKS